MQPHLLNARVTLLDEICTAPFEGPLVPDSLLTSFRDLINAQSSFRGKSPFFRAARRTRMSLPLLNAYLQGGVYKSKRYILHWAYSTLRHDLWISDRLYWYQSLHWDNIQECHTLYTDNRVIVIKKRGFILSQNLRYLCNDGDFPSG